MKVLLRNGQKLKVLKVFVTHANPDVFWKDQEGFTRPTDAQIEAFKRTGYAGGTVVDVTDENGESLGEGVAKLHESDYFSKHRGLQVALARALKEAGLAKAERTEVWNQIFCGKYGLRPEEN
jgi:hypothetical protein